MRLEKEFLQNLDEEELKALPEEELNEEAKRAMDEKARLREMNKLSGELQAKVEKVHFFHAPFYKYKDSRLYNGDFAALHSEDK